LAVGIAVATDQIAFTDDAAQQFATLFFGALVIRGVFAALEEFGWRGYLEPRLHALGVPAARRHLIVAGVWAVWHIPYVLTADLMTDLSLAAYIPLFMLATVPMAFIYGVMRERTGSVWPAVVMHGVANAVAFALLDSAVVSERAPWAVSARPEGLVVLVSLTIVAVIVWRRGSARTLPRSLTAK
jgi:membrane protease YdiL (CAAX protease family)